MITTPEKIRMPTVAGGSCEMLINWREGVKGEYLKLRVNGEEVIIPRASFSKIAIMLAREDEQDAMVPTKSILVRYLRKMVTIKLNKNMKAGEHISIPVEFKVPLNEDSSIPIIQ